jgi:hypothetical protein
MRTRSRAYRITGWFALIGGGAIALLMLASLRWYVSHYRIAGRAADGRPLGCGVGVSGMTLGIGWWDHEKHPLPLGWALGRHDGTVWLMFRHWQRPYEYLGIPLWAPLAGAVAPWAIIASRDARRRRSGWCVRCGYDRAGATVCPECGTIAAAEPGIDACSRDATSARP